MQQISPAEIGLRVDYDSKNWTPWNPDKWVIHYGGGWNHAGNPPFTVEKEMRVLRGWEDYHIDGQGWLGLAYNYGIGQTGALYRIRGEQRSGATSGDEDSDGIPENHEARAVVFILGGDQKPSPEALNTFSEFWATDPMRVIGHRDSTTTPCPGEHLYAWIQSKGYEDMFTPHETEELKQAVEALDEVESNGTALKYMVLHLREGGKHWTRAQIAAIAAASAAGGATAGEVIQEIIARLGG